MIKNLLAAILTLLCVQTGIAQAVMSNYNYIIVPDQFEFQSERDQYQLNSMATFILNKHGFNAFLNSEAPNSNRCQGLFADVVKESAILKKRLVLVVKDCNGLEVYRSEGSSKYKEYKKAYHESLREAFKGVRTLGVHQKDVVLLSELSSQTVVKAPKEQTIVVQEPTIDIKESDNEQNNILPTISDENTGVEVSSVSSTSPKAKYTNYTRNGVSFLLRKTSEGYALYEETTASEDGLQLIGKIEAEKEGAFYFVDASEKIYKAFFDASENLVIQKGTISEVYKK
ncbi:hypothetical protein [Ulvibacter antarcticus]|uniref:TLP18.3/Psb32/MOLO-1 phosphatase superfamily protein n=1 Tax=Ulvibacter antarcticus TaxID=442714 RepID=A0A3L9Y8T5_9FLAO|nr:hypothetical protein [Ulvibacter antarcticus]RMA57106.1 hypothetical protein BXY75_2987 [Ulvibacter antarcticus]